MSRVHFVSSFPAFFYDSKHDALVEIVISVDRNGQRWRRYNDGPDVPIESPELPQRAKGNRRMQRRARRL